MKPDEAEITQHDFERMYNEYYGPLFRDFPCFETLTAKWPLRSMVPGFSDFDGRIICKDGTKVADYVALDEAVGRMHLHMLETHPEWGRILEHPAGITVTWEELLADDLYQPETHHWDFVRGDEAPFRRFRAYLESRHWEERDEYYYLKRFFYYYSPYIHGIDPPINMGSRADRYAAHSRILHYCVPAVQAGLSVYFQEPIRGKFDTIERWQALHPQDRVVETMVDCIESGYRRYDILEQPGKLAELEDDLWQSLRETLEMIRSRVSIIEMDDGQPFEMLKERLDAFKEDPLLTIFNCVRFCRIRKGRYWCYLNAPATFDTDWLVANELSWLRNAFTKGAFECYGRLRCGRVDMPLGELLDAIRPEMIDAADEQAIRRVFSLAWDPAASGHERECLRQIAEVIDVYYAVLERLLADARTLAATGVSE